MEPFEQRAMQSVLGWDPVDEPESAAELLAGYFKADFDALSTESDGVLAEPVEACGPMAGFQVLIAGHLLEVVVSPAGSHPKGVPELKEVDGV